MFLHFNPHPSVRHVGHEVGVSKTLVQNFFLINKLQSYKPDLVQHFHITNPEKKIKIYFLVYGYI